jgi:ribosomal-protein-alanine acetyltransferase
MTYRVVRAQLEDLPDMIQAEAELFGSDAWSPELMVEEVSHPHSYYLVARTDPDGGLAGYGGLRAAPAGGDQGDIQTLATTIAHRGVGLGRTLLRALLEEAHIRGVEDIFLEVRADNPVARALYESEGFATIDLRRGYYQPEGVDALVMHRAHQHKKPGWTVGHE